MDKMQTQEMISALADGQLRGDEFARAVEAACGDAAARAAWRDYHLVGDVLRSGELAPARDPDAFVERLRARLQAEQPAIELIAAQAIPVRLAGQFDAQTPDPAANDGAFRWKLVAGFASLAAVAAVGWSVVGGLGTPGAQPQLAAAPAGTVLAGAERPEMIRDAKLDEFLAAHRQLGGASALQMPSGFLRNATFSEGAAR